MYVLLSRRAFSDVIEGVALKMFPGGKPPGFPSLLVYVLLAIGFPTTVSYQHNSFHEVFAPPKWDIVRH